MFSCPHFHSNAILPVAALKSHSHNLLMKHCNTVGLKLDIRIYVVVINGSVTTLSLSAFYTIDFHWLY